MRYQAGGAPEFIGYVDDIRDPRRVSEKGYPILAFEDLLALGDVGAFVPILDPATRRLIHRKLSDHGIPILGARGLPHLSHPDAVVGEGSIVIATTRLGHSTTLGRGAVVLSTMIAHDVQVGEFCSFAFGSLVLGHVSIGNDVFIGAGAIIQNGTLSRPVTIGDGAVIGAGAIVKRSVKPGQVVVGPRTLTLEQWRSSRPATPPAP